MGVVLTFWHKCDIMKKRVVFGTFKLYFLEGGGDFGNNLDI